MRDLVNLANERDRKELRELESEILSWDCREAQDLMAVTLDILWRRGEDAGGLWQFASAYRWDNERAGRPEGAFAQGAARLLMGDERGIALFKEGCDLSGYEPFWLHFSRYAIRRSGLPQETKQVMLTTFEQDFEKGATYVLDAKTPVKYSPTIENEFERHRARFQR